MDKSIVIAQTDRVQVKFQICMYNNRSHHHSKLVSV